MLKWGIRPKRPHSLAPVEFVCLNNRNTSPESFLKNRLVFPTLRPLSFTLLITSLFVSSAVYAQSPNTFSIAINAGSGLSGNTAALAAFNRAGAMWAQYISNPITITIDADLTSTGFNSANIIGQTESTFVYDTFNNTRNAIAAQAVTEQGDAILNYLPTQAQFNANVPSGVTLNTNFIIATKANFKALGYTTFNYAGTPATTNDGIIKFNSAFNFDYDNRDGVDAGKIDFETVAAHEIGHLLGFTSVVDDIDYYLGNNIANQTVYAQPLDLFRFSSAALPTDGASFTTAARELRPGSPASFSDTINAYSMATGQYRGDGNQASHWKDDGSGNGGPLNASYVGIMDPTLPSGVKEPITAADLRALDLIGYKITTSADTPEPSTFALLGGPALLGVVTLGIRRRRTNNG